MKKAKVLLVALIAAISLIGAAACTEPDDKNSASESPVESISETTGESLPESTSESASETKPREIGVVFADDEPSADGSVSIDYRNALAGLTFYEKASPDRDPVTDELTSFTVEGVSVAAENYEYASGILELTEDYIRSFELGKSYAATVSFGETSLSFTLKFTDDGAPAFRYLADDLLGNVYLTGSEIELPVAVRAPASVQNISAAYSLTRENGEEVATENGTFVATEGKYVYTATFMKNGKVSSEKKNTFVVIDLAKANLAGKDVSVVFGGVYDDAEGAAKYTGTCALSEIDIPESYRFARIRYKGEGKIVCGEEEFTLSSREYTVARLSLSAVKEMKIVSEKGVFAEEFTLSEVSAFNAEDISTLDFSKKEFFSLWNYNADYGTPVYDEEADGISFTGTNNSWPYTLQKGIIRTAYDNGYKYLVIAYTGKGTTRIYNNATGDWGGFSRDLAEGTSRRIAYNLDEAAKKAELDETAGFSVITNDKALILTEFRFYRTDVVVEEEGIYNKANLVAKELADKWSHNEGGSDAAFYSDEEKAMVFPANGNYDTFNFEHEALRKAQKKGYTALKFTVKGSAGEISLFVESNWDRNVKFAVNTNGGYAEGILYFGDLVFNEKSGIAILSSNEKGGDPVLIEEMRFTNDLPDPEPDYTAMNLVSEELLEKWYYNEGSGVRPSYDNEEKAMVFPSNGNYDTYTLSHGIVKEAKEKGYNAVKFTVKGANASVRVFVDNSWAADEIYNVNSESGYVSSFLALTGLSLGDGSGITFLVSDATGGRALYVKELKFEKIALDDEIVSLIGSNLASEENLKYWVGDERGGSASYDAGQKALKLDYAEGKKSGVKFAFDKLFLYAKLLGKTKIVWTKIDTDTQSSGRVRIYADDAQYLSSDGADPSVNILGAKVNNARVCEMEIAKGTETSVFAIDNCKTTVCNMVFTEIRFV